MHPHNPSNTSGGHGPSPNIPVTLPPSIKQLVLQPYALQNAAIPSVGLASSLLSIQHNHATQHHSVMPTLLKKSPSLGELATSDLKQAQDLLKEKRRAEKQPIFIAKQKESEQPHKAEESVPEAGKDELQTQKDKYEAELASALAASGKALNKKELEKDEALRQLSDTKYSLTQSNNRVSELEIQIEKTVCFSCLIVWRLKILEHESTQRII